MQRYGYHLRLLTPTFLGNASQQAQWRTPPAWLCNFLSVAEFLAREVRSTAGKSA